MVCATLENQGEEAEREPQNHDEVHGSKSQLACSCSAEFLDEIQG